jgi:TolA-binding protein
VSAPREGRLRALGRHIAAEQDAALAASEALATRAATLAVAEYMRGRRSTRRTARAKRPGTQSRLIIASAVAMAACAALLFVRTRPVEVAVVGGAALAAGDTLEAHDRALARSTSRTPERTRTAPREASRSTQRDTPRATGKADTSGAPTDKSRSAAVDESVATPAASLRGAKPSSPASWQQLARAGEFAAAYKLGREVDLTSQRAEDALMLADTARLSGDTSAALRLYQQLRQLHPGSDAAAAAAFASGQVLFDQRSAYLDAARWFETYLHERGHGPLARQARGRLLEALERCGQHRAARRAARKYLRAYPSGPHATFARRLL